MGGRVKGGGGKLLPSVVYTNFRSTASAAILLSILLVCVDQYGFETKQLKTNVSSHGGQGQGRGHAANGPEDALKKLEALMSLVLSLFRPKPSRRREPFQAPGLSKPLRPQSTSLPSWILFCK